jgi:hypothetical protein
MLSTLLSTLTLLPLPVDDSRLQAAEELEAALERAASTEKRPRGP